MGAGASAPKKGSRRANDMVNQLDEEIAICDDAARDSLEMLQEESNEGKQTSPFNKNKAKRKCRNQWRETFWSRWYTIIGTKATSVYFLLFNDQL